MLLTKRSAGVAPEVNLRNPLHGGDEAHKQETQPCKVDFTRSPKQQVIIVPTKGLKSSKILKKTLTLTEAQTLNVNGPLETDARILKRFCSIAVSTLLY